MNYWPKVMCSQVSTQESPEINDGSCIDPDSCVEYINKELNEELHFILGNRHITSDFCQGHIFNGFCAKLALNLNAKAVLFILSDPRQHKKFFFNFHNFNFTAPFESICRAFSKMLASTKAHAQHVPFV